MLASREIILDGETGKGRNRVREKRRNERIYKMRCAAESFTWLEALLVLTARSI